MAKHRGSKFPGTGRINSRKFVFLPALPSRYSPVSGYTLFVDTETSGMPTNWQRPYAEPGAWPHIAQVAWLLYGPDGELVKSENHYVRPSDYDISPASGRIHGLTLAFLQEHGEPRRTVMQRLHDDLVRYRPLVVGHFLALDFHMVGVSFHRSELSNPLVGLPTFCTMRFTERFMQPVRQQYLRLADLYHRQFGRPMLNQHDALADAEATAQCYFEMWRKGDIDAQTVADQPPLLPPPAAPPSERPPFWQFWRQSA
jgi:DNA polymerase-3 subunit epsilon